MGNTSTRVIDGQVITIVEDTREDLQDFLGEAQDIERLDEEEQKERLKEIFGEEEEQDSDKEDSEEQEEELSPEAQERKDEIESRQSSRANVDVALAMQIADQVAAESAAEAAENPCYVVHGAKVLCSQGSREARLVTPLDHGVLLGGKPQMLAGDSASLENVMCFGNCFSVENPKMAQAAVDATNRYNEEKSKGFWGTVKSWFGIKPKVVTEVSKELQQLCICECEPCFPEGALWVEGHEGTKITDKETLIQPATLVCNYGGVIRIIDNGQNG